jgi:hypothetical protein
MVAGEGGIRWMSEKQMDVVSDEWTWLEKKMLKQEVQEIGKDACQPNPYHHGAPLLYHRHFLWLQRVPAPAQRSSPYKQEEKQPAENQPIGTKDHKCVQYWECPCVDIEILKECKVELE